LPVPGKANLNEKRGIRQSTTQKLAADGTQQTGDQHGESNYQSLLKETGIELSLEGWVAGDNEEIHSVAGMISG
jgi:hypothetical protein